MIGGTGLSKTPIWSQSQGGYVTIAVDGKEIHKTPVVDTTGDPQWKDTFQLYPLFNFSDNGHQLTSYELTISIYATKVSSSNTFGESRRESRES